MSAPPPSAVAVIPARMGSSRFPGKPLAPLLGRPMIEHVYRRVAMSRAVRETYVATCDEEIRKAAEAFGAPVIMTSPAHERASERVAEAARALAADIVVLVQGDEPMTTPGMVDAAVAPMQADPSIGCANLAARITTEAEWRDPNTIKVVMDRRGNALYFSRQPIPSCARGFDRVPVFKQVCVIPFRRATLLEYAALAPTPLERAESIDMMRLLEHGRAVRMVETDACSHAVDTDDDRRRVEALLREDPLSRTYLG
ncbi:MAG: 3-deoxy-manno-octulosonate cytidylyltransferase [Candidatus Rokubacteria bacterium]|nr:3-deoxy-manno-octulosonate cytidylyltransferase [Candidatus Rokubacteria bacterium]